MALAPSTVSHHPGWKTTAELTVRPVVQAATEMSRITILSPHHNTPLGWFFFFFSLRHRATAKFTTLVRLSRDSQIGQTDAEHRFKVSDSNSSFSTVKN